MANLLEVQVQPLTDYKRDPQVTTKQQEYWFVFDGVDIDTENQVLYNPISPQPFSICPTNNYLFCIDLGVKTHPNLENVQILAVTWSNRYSTGDGSAQNASQLKKDVNPLKRPAVIRHQCYKRTKVIDVDIDGKPFITTAGEAIIHQEEVTNGVVVVNKNVNAKNPLVLTQKDYMNSDSVKIDGVKYPPKTLWLTDITYSELMLENGFFFFVLSFAMYHNPDTWMVKKKNVGYVHMSPWLTGTNGQAILGPDLIRIGNPPRPTTIPLPLQNKPNNTTIGNFPDIHGMVFQEYLTAGPGTANPQTGAWTITSNQTIPPARMKQIWDEATLEFQTKPLLKFTGNVPLS